MAIGFAGSYQLVSMTTRIVGSGGRPARPIASGPVMRYGRIS